MHALSHGARLAAIESAPISGNSSAEMHHARRCRVICGAISVQCGQLQQVVYYCANRGRVQDIFREADSHIEAETRTV